jgi:zinc transporter
MNETGALVYAYRLDGRGGGVSVDWAELMSTADSDGLWVHLDRSHHETREWLSRQAALDPLIVEALLEEETRPRCEAFEDGLLIILRGVNLNPGADPDDMIAIRIWIDGNRVISTRARRLMAAHDTRERLEAGRGPTDPAELLVSLAGNLIQRMGPVIDGLEENVDTLEEEVMLHGSRSIRGRLIEMRQQTIGLRRYLSPQREALGRLLNEDRSWLRARDKSRLREIADRTLRYIDDLDNVRERAAIVQDELMSRLSEQMNRTMYVLTVVAAVMLPLGFITGLLGINVGGIPGSDSPFGFAVVCGALVVIVVAQVWIFRRLRWI